MRVTRSTFLTRTGCIISICETRQRCTKHSHNSVLRSFNRRHKCPIHMHVGFLVPARLFDTDASITQSDCTAQPQSICTVGCGVAGLTSSDEAAMSHPPPVSRRVRRVRRVTSGPSRRMSNRSGSMDASHFIPGPCSYFPAVTPRAEPLPFKRNAKRFLLCVGRQTSMLWNVTAYTTQMLSVKCMYVEFLAHRANQRCGENAIKMANVPKGV